MPKITHDRLLELLEYNHNTGLFRWKVKKARADKGDVAGYMRPGDMRRRIKIDGILYYSSHLVWFYVTGQWPEREVDHRNLIPSDDRFDNLRLADSTQNKGNRRMQKNNSSGFKGVGWSKRYGKWRARIKCGKELHLGYFDDPAKAAAAYASAAKELFGEFARLS